MNTKTYLDKSLLKSKKIYFSPGSHKKTIEISNEDYIDLVNPEIIEFEKKQKKKESTLGLNVTREENFSEWYTQVIQKSEMADYTQVSGCIVFRPYSYRIWEKVQEYVDKRLKEMGVKNAYFPLFIPEKLLVKEQDHVEGFSPEVAWVTHAGNSKLNEKLAVRPTSETIMYDSYKKWIRSYRDLPLRLNQWNNVVRWEFKYAVPFLRTREFLWHEGHTVFATKKEADQEVIDILNLYEDCFKELYAIPVIKGKKSNKEKFAGADYTTSVEIFLPNNKAIQGATSHALGQNFAKSFDIIFLDENSKKRYPWQNSWAITTRSIGIMIMMHGDDKGLVIPPRVAPIQVVIVPILFEKTKKQVLKKAEEIKELLDEFSVELDDREDYTPGWKFNEWELKGVPIRIEIGPRDLKKNQAVIVRRDTGEKIFVKIKDLKEQVRTISNKIHENLYNKAKKFMEKNQVTAETWEEFKQYARDRKMIKALHCGKEECEDWIKHKTTGVKTLNIPFDSPKNVKGKCIHCDKKAKYWINFAKSY
ncbi:proline--tRNA ligase [Candidatus Woesearchaeota archaeon]|nr:proline--tRNA ligase [Candidatus Woesearchaeota archaeon]